MKRWEDIYNDMKMTIHTIVADPNANRRTEQVMHSVLHSERGDTGFI